MLNFRGRVPTDVDMITISKVIERLVLSRLEHHLNDSRNFCHLHSTYRSGHSTETSLLHVLNRVYTAADEKRATVLVALESRHLSRF